MVENDINADGSDGEGELQDGGDFGWSLFEPLVVDPEGEHTGGEGDNEEGSKLGEGDGCQLNLGTEKEYEGESDDGSEQEA